MRNRLNIPVDDHFAGIIIRALREQSKRDTGIYKALNLICANQIEQEMNHYQNEQEAVLSELRGVKNQIASTKEAFQ